MFKRTWILTAVVLVGVLAAACGPAQTPAATGAAVNPTEKPAQPTVAMPATEAAKPAEKVVLNAGWLGKPDTLNPAYAFLTESYIVFDLVYSTLTKEVLDGTYAGDLAKEWKHSEDGKTWTFTLNDGIKWHDGSDLSAEDVAWSINAVMEAPDAWSTISNYVIGFTSVKALDAKTVEIQIENPVSNMEYRLSFLFAMPKKVFEKYTTAEDLQNFTNFEILGTGPFKMNTFDKDNGILILDANPDYYGGQANIDQVVFQTFDNADAMVQAIKVGDIDMMIEVPTSAFEMVKGFENVKTVNESGIYLNELIISSAPMTLDPKPTRNPALDDPAVKLAIAQSMNKQDLVDIVYRGLATPGTTIIPPSLGGGFWHNPEIKDVSFDLEAAKKTLEDAGYKVGADGVRAKGDVKLDFRLQFPSDSAAYPRVADLLAGWLKEAGIKVTPQAVDPDALTAAITPLADYDLVLWGYGSDPDPDFMLSVMTTDQFVEGGWSDSGYSNPEYDQMYLDQQTIIDKAERQKMIWKMQEMVFNDRAYIVYCYENTLQAYRSDRFTGFIESPVLQIESVYSLLQVKPVQ